jgi:hypothetical protein
MPDRPARLWAVTSYFNPMRWERRRRNYRLFREALGVPLVAAEVHDGEGDLGPEDAEMLISLRGEPAIWQKERLLNLAIAALPPEAEYVLWIDCDLTFEQAGWAEAATAALDAGADVVQPFAICHRLGPDGNPEKPVVQRAFRDDERVFDLTKRRGFAASYAQEPEVTRARFYGDVPATITALRANERTAITAPGLAWIARRERIGVRGLYDRHVVGGGDSVFVAGLLGGHFADARRPISPAHLADVKAWLSPFRRERWRMAHVDGRIIHHWHGDTENRQYFERYRLLVEHGYDPARHLRLAENGTWEWTEPGGPLAAAVRRFFHDRLEDGTAA